MGVRLIVGRAGTGKTALCVREIREEMARDPLGPPLLWITPAQATFSSERQLLGTGEGARGRGTFRAQVLSFRRLALIVARELGLFPQAAADTVSASGRAGKPMDDLARRVLLEEMLRQERGALQVFAGAADRPGFAVHLDTMLRELRQQGHSGASLRELAEARAAAFDSVTRLKLLDLAHLLDAWSRVMQDAGTWDFEQIMHQAALRLGESKLITGEGGARVWVDAFSAMTALEVRMLAELGRCTRQVSVTLLADPDAPVIQEMRAEGGHPRDVPEGLFARTERLYLRLMDAFRVHHVPMERPLMLRQRHRFSSPQVRQVEAELFEDMAPPASRPENPPPAQTEAPPAGAARPDPPKAGGRKKSGRYVEQRLTLWDLQEQSGATASPASPEALSVPDAGAAHGVPAGVEIWECSDPETEVRMAAQAIRTMVIAGDGVRGTLRYRQIAIIVPDLPGYADALRRVLSEHAIPHFVDERRSIAHHPLVEFIRAAIAVVTSRFAQDEMLLFLKTQLAGASETEVSLVENYVREHGIDHMPWSVPWKWLAPNESEDDADVRAPATAYERLRQANGVRERIWARLGPFVEVLRQHDAATEPRDTAPLVRALRDLLSALKVEEQVQRWIGLARGAGNAELAQVHEQAWREITQLLALLEALLAGRSRTLAEFERLVATALENLTLGLVPPTVDQVLVTSVTRSRVPEMEVVLVLGAVEGQFPQVIQEDPILSDAQRDAFNAVSADPIGDGAGRQLLEMPFFDYVALTRARRLLVVSHPVADRKGKALSESRHLQRLRDLLQERIVERNLSSASRTEIDRIGIVDDALAGVASWARSVLSTGTPEPPDPAYRQLYSWVMRAPGAVAEGRAWVWGALAPSAPPALSPPIAAKLFDPGKPLRLSISQLEKFAACPLQYFAHYTLGLRPRQDFALDSLSLGLLQHRILEQLYRRIIDEEFDWPRCEAATLRDKLEAEVDRAVEELHAELKLHTPGYDKTRRRVARILGVMMESDRRRACASGGGMRPQHVELYFGNDRPRRDAQGRIVALPVLAVQTPARHVVHLTGKIDRVDLGDGGETAVVIDYKSAVRRTLDLKRVLAGLSLQLPVYALVSRMLGDVKPIAAFYLTLGMYRNKIDDLGDQPAPDSDAFYQKFPPRGVVNAAFGYELDSVLQPDDESGDTGQGKSAWYKLGYNTSGEHAIAKNSDLLSARDFATLLAFTLHKVGTLADELFHGRIAPLPLRLKKHTPCDSCEFSSLCPFDQVRDAYRVVGTEDEALAEMRKAVG